MGLVFLIKLLPDGGHLAALELGDLDRLVENKHSLDEMKASGRKTIQGFTPQCFNDGLFNGINSVV